MFNLVRAGESRYDDVYDMCIFISVAKEKSVLVCCCWATKTVMKICKATIGIPMLDLAWVGMIIFFSIVNI